MGTVEVRLRTALARQFARRKALLDGGAHPVGWKVGAGRAERIGGQVIGYLTSATCLPTADTYRPEPGEQTHADAEIAVVIGADGTVAGYAAAVELCDLRGSDDEADTIVEHNVFHRAYTLGPVAQVRAAETGRLLVNGECRAEAPVPGDLPERVERVAELLAAMGEQLRPDDRIITGSVVQVPVAPGDAVRAEFAVGVADLVIRPRV
jgi:hypothetical protein